MNDFTDALQDASWSAWDQSLDLQQGSFDAWGDSIDYSHMANDAWLAGNTEAYQQFSQLSSDSEMDSNDLYGSSWDSADLSQDLWDASYDSGSSWSGYTASDLAAGYSATDTSFIEPAGAADDFSMIQ